MKTDEVTDGLCTKVREKPSGVRIRVFTKLISSHECCHAQPGNAGGHFKDLVWRTRPFAGRRGSHRRIEVRPHRSPLLDNDAGFATDNKDLKLTAIVILPASRFGTHDGDRRHPED